MKNIKLGDQVYEGVETVRLDMAEGGTVDYAPYHETFVAGRTEGYNAGKEAGLEEGFDNGKAVGIQTEYDRFWDAYELACIRNGPGYQCAFGGPGWNDDTFWPKRDIYPGGGYSVNRMFAQSRITDLAQRLKECGVVLDTSRAQYFDDVFNQSYITHIPVMDCSKAISLSMTFSRMHAAHTIDKIIINEATTFPNTFIASSVLTNITFEGIIGQDINFSWSPLSVASMKSVITHLKNYSGTADAGKKTVKFTDACWVALEADSTAPDGNTWRDYVETTLGWLT